MFIIRFYRHWKLRKRLMRTVEADRKRRNASRQEVM